MRIRIGRGNWGSRLGLVFLGIVLLGLVVAAGFGTYYWIGYTVYMVDYPARGRSPYVPDMDGKLGLRTALELEQIARTPWAFSISAASGPKRSPRRAAKATSAPASANA